MSVLYRKARKLVSNPKGFFQDSKIFNGNRPTENKRNISTDKFSSKDKEQIQIYLNELSLESKVFYNHCYKIFNAHATLNIGNYRLNDNEILFCLNDDVFVGKIEHPVEDNTLLKGEVLISSVENSCESKSFSVIEGVVHKINVQHMKEINDFNMLYYYYLERPESTEQSQIKYALSAGIYEEKVIRGVVSILNERCDKLQLDDLILFFKKAYRILGTDGRLESIANKICNLSKKKAFPVHFLMTLAAFFVESGAYDKAIEIALKAKEKDVDAWNNHRYLGLTYLLFKNGLINECWAEKEHDLFLMLSRNEWEFEQYLETYSHRLAVVGNAPIELNKKKGKYIDSFDKVVRFNGAITDYPYCIDYGKKTNVLIINPRYYETQRNRKYNLDYLVISDGNLYSTKNLFFKVHDLFQYADKICLLPRKLDIALTQKIAASPSSGLKLMHWVYTISGELCQNQVFGFSLTDQAQGVSTSYSSGRRVGLNTIHNWQREREFLESLISSEDVKDYNNEI
ncbi:MULTISPECIES: glycosyltransferase family 29 protein [unclassified Pseudocitrobacter]|uniref:glycosyltransferase family 29 protein n=1 Tax=unclassified Pseudocitrobacter TaxID=2638778 RepID=UPI0023E4444F|nr:MULTISPECIES: glycosyltransferase family 29 protein [unclassified Pseudocitrobacter]MDF3829204.1 glycosyltransferase family 29 protein [Pseudocitrobacter sp. 2023EL-00150]MEC5373171.1 glycosyltransferase family 29 protein [Pseudocitrobacter sp. MW920760]